MLDRFLFISFLFISFFTCFGSDTTIDIFQKTINEQAISPNLQEKLEEIREKSKEADLFIKKYFDKEEAAKDYFEDEIVEKVEKAAAYVASRLYEEGMKNPTDTATLERALLFTGKNGGAAHFDSRSEATMNSIASLRSDIENLLNLRIKYNTSVNGPKFQAFLTGLESILKE